MSILYSILIYIFNVVINLAALFIPKLKLFVQGRKEQKKIIHQLKLNDKKVVWMHCASLGEYEQGRPLLEEFLKQNPNYISVLSFFSPSGYEVKKNSKAADYIFYLPLDTAQNAKWFIDSIHPSVVFWIKYEYWFNHLKELSKRKIPTYLISARFFKNDIQFKWYGKFWKKMLNCFTTIFVQNESSQKLLIKNNIQHCLLSGDTRFDAVKNLHQAASLPHDLIVLKNKFNTIMVLGSAWANDCKILATQQQLFKLWIIAPHNIDKTTIQEISAQFKNVQLYSQYKINNTINFEVLIIDEIGILSRLYQLATICYIGGGFNKSGIHNTLEAATWSKPVLFGPNFKKFNEAVDLHLIQQLPIIKNENDFKEAVDKLLSDKNFYQTTCKSINQFMNNSFGATFVILNNIKTL